ncbi:MAG: hypothetical protein HN855_01905 [Anaerolineae bacterium]|jgi:hypothetical protein|nr:hypothetical protein [Anaerolineae bacterium]MBT7070694.1 hypothetical protein [Anaerolineae bacterium]MBT7323892.1 hypothetical protein [Anaerolineae bacterium]
MKRYLVLIPIIFLLLASCQSQSVDAPVAAPTEAPLPTATLAPTSLPESTETPLPVAEIDPSLFGSVNTADAPVGFMLEPVAQFIFEAELQKRVDAGEIGAFQVEGLSIVPRGDGTFYAEIFYALQADAAFWPEDFGTPGDDGWVRGKCTRFDFESTEEAFFLKNKKVCS